VEKWRLFLLSLETVMHTDCRTGDISVFQEHQGGVKTWLGGTDVTERILMVCLGKKQRLLVEARGTIRVEM